MYMQMNPHQRGRYVAEVNNLERIAMLENEFQLYQRKMDEEVSFFKSKIAFWRKVALFSLVVLMLVLVKS